MLAKCCTRHCAAVPPQQKKLHFRESAVWLQFAETPFRKNFAGIPGIGVWLQFAAGAKVRKLPEFSPVFPPRGSVRNSPATGVLPALLINILFGCNSHFRVRIRKSREFPGFPRARGNSRNSAFRTFRETGKT